MAKEYVSPAAQAFLYIISHPLLIVIAIMLMILIGTGTCVFHKEQQVVVQMPVNAKPLESLNPTIEPPPMAADVKVITSERAVLWWTVYKETFKSESSSYSINAANAAVEKVYGSQPHQ